VSVSGSRALIVGLDGATFTIADPLVRDGRMPNLARLLREGFSAPLQSTTPAITLPAWSSFLTGCSPGIHGILDFVHREPGTYRLTFTNSTHRLVPTVHEWISSLGGRVASVAVPTTYPPTSVNGVVISGFDSPVALGIDGSFVHPPALAGEIFQRFGGMKFADFQEIHIGPGWHTAALRSLEAEIQRKEAICRWLLEQERWDLFMVVFGETDTVAHHFWMFCDPNSPRYPGDSVAAPLRDAIARVYECCDRALGVLLDAAGAEQVIVASDHGFGGAGDRILYLNRFLENKGWLQYRRERVGAQGFRWGSHWVDRGKAFAIDHLPATAQERLFRALPNSWLSGIESRSRYGEIDFSKTQAWSDENNYAATIHLNVRGREPLGVISNRDEAIGRLSEDLLSWEEDGIRVVRRVFTREQLFEGPALERAPDLVLELSEPQDYSWTVLPSVRVERGTTHRRLATSELMGGKGFGMNGSHRPQGVLVLHGKAYVVGERGAANIQDCMPTWLTAAGWPVPDYTDGRVLQNTFAMPTRPRYHRFDSNSGATRTLRRSEEASLRARLQSLGYL
jgi:predicted AlkP superfamily phosphohydrolase/phosphomutase